MHVVNGHQLISSMVKQSRAILQYGQAVNIKSDHLFTSEKFVSLNWIECDLYPMAYLQSSTVGDKSLHAARGGHSHTYCINS